MFNVFEIDEFLCFDFCLMELILFFLLMCLLEFVLVFEVLVVNVGGVIVYCFNDGWIVMELKDKWKCWWMEFLV